MQNNVAQGSYYSELFSIKTIVINVTLPEFVDYTTTLVTNPENPHDATKQPIQGVLKLTPEVSRINPFYKFADRSAKKKNLEKP